MQQLANYISALRQERDSLHCNLQQMEQKYSNVELKFTETC
jgi:predicted nuclease with TOPRIM domain